ncbi:MAG: Ldh family oxidoreductase [Chloroflexi bacterium]|nr:Ldh family oxidoreductase [Chloroflexota bacterium]
MAQQRGVKVAEVNPTDSGKLRAFVRDVLTAMNVPRQDAETVSEILVEADLRGVDSHGVTRLGGYVQMIRSGIINPRPKIQVVKETPSTAVIDGDKAFGMPVAKRAMEMTLDKAKQVGLAGVTARNMSHTGMVGFYTMMAASRGMVGMAMNNGPTIVPPFGGITPNLSTNPMSVAFPAGKEEPIVLDMATTVVAGGKFRLAAKKGLPIPKEWALDRSGVPTDDPNEAIEHGFFQWAGGYKGFGLATMVEVLGGVLSGGLFGQEVPPMIHFGKDPITSSGFYLAIDIERFMPLAEFQGRVDTLVRQLLSSKLAKGVERIYVAGGPEFERKRQRTREGIPLSAPVYEELLRLSRELELPFDLAFSGPRAGGSRH